MQINRVVIFAHLDMLDAHPGGLEFKSAELFKYNTHVRVGNIDYPALVA